MDTVRISLDSTERFAILSAINKLKRQRDEVLNGINTHIQSLEMLLQETQPVTILPKEEIKQFEPLRKKQDNETWAEYAIALVRPLGNCKTRDILAVAEKANPALDREFLRKALVKALSTLVGDKKLKATKSKIQSEGYTYHLP